jgi:predicted aspartyl protease
VRKRFIIYMGALLLGLLAGGAGAAETKGCELKRFASLPLETLPDGRVAIPFTVDNRPLSFMVDTGGVSATITGDQARQLGHPVQQTSRQLIGVDGNIMGDYITVDTLSVGGMKGEKLPIYIETRGMKNIDGTMSPDMLQGYDVDFDFARGVMNLFSQKHCRGKVVYWTKTGVVVLPMDVDRTGHVRVPVMVDGKKIMATLDTGAVRSLVSLRAAANLGIDEKTPGLKLVQDEGRNKFYSYPFHSLDLDGVSVSNPHIDIASDNFTKGMGSDLILGMGILRQLHLYIAYDEERLYITPALAN